MTKWLIFGFVLPLCMYCHVKKTFCSILTKNGLIFAGILFLIFFYWYKGQPKKLTALQPLKPRTVTDFGGENNFQYGKLPRLFDQI